MIVSVACADLTKPQGPVIPSYLSAFTLVPLTGAAFGANDGLTFTGGRVDVAQADTYWNFDVAFDLTPDGLPVVLPVRAVASAFVPAVKRVGLQVVSGSFDNLREAPRTGYDTLSIVTLRTGQVLALEIRDFLCQYSLGNDVLYAKLTIDSINYTSRRLYVRTVVDPNCGRHGLVADSIPAT